MITLCGHILYVKSAKRTIGMERRIHREGVEEDDHFHGHRP